MANRSRWNEASALRYNPTDAQPEALKPSKKTSSDSFTEAARKRISEAAVKDKPKPTDDTQPTMTYIRAMKWKAEQQRQAAKTQSLIEEAEDVARQE